jgi:putative transposase
MLRLTGVIGTAAAILSVASGCAWHQACCAGRARQRNALRFLRNAPDYLPRKADDDCLQELREFAAGHGVA